MEPSAQPEHEWTKTIKFYVDTDAVTTDKRKLKVREILTLSGNTPPKDYELERLAGHSNQGKTYTDLEEEVEVHPDERFSATFTGETPYS